MSSYAIGIRCSNVFNIVPPFPYAIEFVEHGPMFFFPARHLSNMCAISFFSYNIQEKRAINFLEP